MKKTLHISLFCLLIFLLVQFVSSQEIVRKGIHELQMKDFGNIEKGVIKSMASKESIISLQMGQAIMQVHPKSESINISHLTNGLYFLYIEDKAGNKGSFKILKSN
jgi:mannitol/fructose-specific phosphotransferase system IIA component